MNPATRPSSPTLQENVSHTGQDDEAPPLAARTHSFSHLADTDTGHSKERSHLEVILDAQHLTLKGTGVDVESARLSGHVMLHLSEDTPLKEITLQFRGKGRIPIHPSEFMPTSNASSMTYVICNHEWSFLEGDKKHTHTLKAGRHVFPFHLQIDGNLPSTIGTSVLGGVSVFYKLRAIAVRPGLNHNLQAIIPVYIDRSLSHEALEYQQTLEIENTWPEKVMYSIVLPHKAWAAGDNLTAIFKFSPIAKGIRITHIRTAIHETTKVYGRTGAQENTHVVASIYHDIIDGEPIVLDTSRSGGSSGQARNVTVRPDSAIPNNESSSSSPASPSLPLHLPPPNHPTPASISGGSEESGAEDSNDLALAISIPIPVTSITPTHSLEPVIVSHRVRWNIFIKNMDGHTSELRCSLPIHVLHHRLLEEARSFSAATRRLVLGSSDSQTEEEVDRELPSYAAHVRDRVANIFFPEAATVRVNNPWINHVSSSQVGSDVQQELFTSIPSSRVRSGFSSPVEPHGFSHLPHAPGPGGIATLDILRSELLLSLSDSPLRQEIFTPEPHTPSEQSFFDVSQPPSQNRSRPQSRYNSRPASPDVTHLHHHYGHDSTAANHSSHSRNLHSIFRATMRPFTSLGHHKRHGGHHSQDDDQHHARLLALHAEPIGHHSQPASSPEQVTRADLLHRAFTEVPDYSIASRGFIGGGVPPLESMRGLPSYEEAAGRMKQETTSCGTNLAVGAGRACSGSGGTNDNQGRPREERPSSLERASSFPL